MLAILSGAQVAQVSNLLPSGESPTALDEGAFGIFRCGSFGIRKIFKLQHALTTNLMVKQMKEFF